MDEPFNPYAAPSTLAPAAEAVAWQAAPDETLRKVAFGLNFTRAGTTVALLGSVVVLAMILFPLFGKMDRETRHLLYLGIDWMLIAAYGLGFVGSLHCLSAPPETYPRGWVGATVLAAMLNIIVSVGAVIRVSTVGGRHTSELLAIFACMTFLMFLRNLGRSLGRDDLARRAFGLLILSGVLTVVLLAYMALTAYLSLAGGQQLPMPAVAESMLYLAIVLSMLALPVVFNILYLVLLTNLRSAILRNGNLLEETILQ